MKIISTLTVAIVVSVSLSISAASAVDFKAEIRGLDGKPIPASETDKTPVTLGSIAEVALISPGGLETLTPDEKSRRFFLALKIHEGKGDRLTVEELALVKKAIGAVYGPLVYGRAVELIDGAPGSVREAIGPSGGNGGPAAPGSAGGKAR